MAGSMNRLHDLLPRIIHELDEELLVGVLGLDNWGYVTMGPDRNPDSMPSDGWGLFHPPEYYYYMDQPSTTTTPATTNSMVSASERPYLKITGGRSCECVSYSVYATDPDSMTERYQMRYKA